MGNANSNIEGNEDDDEDEMMAIRDGGQIVVTSIPNEVKPRPKIGRQAKSGKLSASGSKSKTESLRSALSVDGESQEVEKMRREFELFRLSKENELTNVRKREKKLDTENKKLKTELQALQKTCKKLRDERDFALDAEQRALRRASSIENDRDKIQRQFKIYRETKENEVQSLLKTKRNLETKLLKFEPDEMNDGCQPVKNIDLMKSDDWLLMEPSDTLHSTYMQQQQQSAGNVTSDALYVNNQENGSTSNDQNSVMKNFSNVINVIVLNVGGTKYCSRNMFENFKNCLNEICNKRFHICNFWKFDCKNSKLSEDVLKHISMNNFLTIIILIGDIDISGEEVDENICTFHHHEDSNFNSLVNIIQSFIIKEMEIKDSKYTQDCLNYLGWDNVWLWQRMQESYYHRISSEVDDPNNKTFNHLYQHAYKPYFDQLFSHMATSGPQLPLLVEADEGAMVTELLVKWMDEYRTKCTLTLMMRYFVAPSFHHSSADPSIIIRCFMFQIMQCLSTPFALTSDPSQLILEFPKWLDKVSVLFPGGVVLVVDRIDCVENFEAHFDWLLDPLPADLRVIISTNQNNSPASWGSFPILKIQPLQRNEIKQIFDLSPLTFKKPYDLDDDDDDDDSHSCECLNVNDFNELLDHLSLNSQLCRVTFVVIICRVLLEFRFNTVAMKILKSEFFKCKLVVDLYRVLLVVVVVESGWVDCDLLMKIVAMVTCCRDGLSEFDLFNLLVNDDAVKLNNHSGDKNNQNKNDYSAKNNRNKNDYFTKNNHKNNHKNNQKDNNCIDNNNNNDDNNNDNNNDNTNDNTNDIYNNNVINECDVSNDEGYKFKIITPCHNNNNNNTKVHSTCFNNNNDDDDDDDDDDHYNREEDGDDDGDDEDNDDDDDGDGRYCREMKFWFRLHSVLNGLLDLKVVKVSVDGLYILHNEYVEEALKELLNYSDEMRSCVEKLKTYFKNDLQNFRNIDKLLNMESTYKHTNIEINTKDKKSNNDYAGGGGGDDGEVGGDKDGDGGGGDGGLEDYLSRVQVAVNLLERGASRRLHQYWTKLGIPMATVANGYMDRLIRMDDFDSTTDDTAKSCQYIGRFFMDCSLNEQASMLFQRALELLETQLDPDDPKIGQVLDLLSRSHEKLGHKGTSEALHMQALEIFKGASQQQQQLCYREELDRQEHHLKVDNQSAPSSPLDNDPNSLTITNNEIETISSTCNEINNDGVIGIDVNNSSGIDVNNSSGSFTKYHYNVLVAAQLDALANLYQKQGRLDQAENFVKRAVSLRKKLTKRVTFAQPKQES